MLGLAHAAKILSLLTGLGTLIWMAFAVVAGSPEYGNTSFDTAGSVGTAGRILAAAAAVYFAAALLVRRFG